MSLREGLEWTVFDTPVALEEVTAPTVIEDNTLKIYAKDKSGVSALYYKDDAEVEHDLSGGLTGTGVANRIAYWASASVLAANAALTLGRVPFADSNGLLTDSAGLFFDSANVRVGVGTSTPQRGIHVKGSGAINTPIIIERSDGLANFSGFNLTGSPTVNNAFLALFGGGGSHDGTFANAAVTSLFAIYAGENWTSTAKGSYLTFETTPLGSTTRAEAFRVSPSKHLIGVETATDPTAAQLTSGSNAKDRLGFYMKNDKIVFAYNNGGTVTYVTLALDGSATTWVHNTTAP